MLNVSMCRVKFMQVDTISWEAQLAAFKATLAWSSSRLDIVIPSAGVSGVLGKEYFTNLSPTDDPPKPSTLAFDVNLTGVYYTALLAIHYFNTQVANESFKPQLCFMSSLAGYGDMPFSADYSATKWGVRGIWRSLRGVRGVNSLGGIQANLIAPTFLRTAMTASFVEQLEQAGAKVGEVGDAVEGVLRAVADDEVDGEFRRALFRTIW
jgi:5'-hydroxyaverantin dehydrogenase